MKDLNLNNCLHLFRKFHAVSKKKKQKAAHEKVRQVLEIQKFIRVV